MHELMITENILDIALRYAQKEVASRITDLYLVIGELSSVIDDSVGFYWDIVSEGTIAEGANLHFRRLPAVLACLDCGYQFSPKDNITCQSCDGNRIKLVCGQEFYLDSIEVAGAESANNQDMDALSSTPNEEVKTGVES